ncbi:MAG TPA: class I SAM-dependent methyltransferase [Roseomonas sp.]|jgi:hypothetical protein
MAETTLRRRLFEEAQVNGGSWHQAGNLPARVVDFMWNALDLHFPGGPNLTVETGCGLSTILLGSRSRKHICFTLGEGDDSLVRVRGSSLFRSEATHFVLGPSQATLHDLRTHIQNAGAASGQTIDFALIDGAHAYPFPELDYWHIYPHLSHWGLLAIDDVHIPTIKRLYEFLREDAMYDFYALVENTAFFVRNAKPTFDPYGDGWDLQGFNRKALGWEPLA